MSARKKGFTSMIDVVANSGNPSSEENRPYVFLLDLDATGSAGLSRQRNKAL